MVNIYSFSPMCARNMNRKTNKDIDTEHDRTPRTDGLRGDVYISLANKLSMISSSVTP
jgi:hypothetical protein